MNSSIINAAVSMGSMQQKLDLLADNIANLNTAGYKRKDATFEDLLTSIKQQDETFRQPVRLTPMGFNQGWGSRLTMVESDFSQGTMKETGNAYDIGIQGNALFEVQTSAEGGRAFTRSGAFYPSLNGAGQAVLTTTEGYTLIAEHRTEEADGTVTLTEGPIVIPDNYDVRIGADGQVTGVSTDGFTTVDLGQIKLVQPVRPSVLTPVADNLYLVADGLDAGAALQELGADERDGVTLMQGYLEQSNVNLSGEMADLVMVQRAYQLSARALSSGDRMMELATSLRR
ncbi:flagellar hook-basal body protein [Paenibacillus sp. IB182496]|uniref:Flagellar hook-basal body protein n=1 Tax=Paenibacillus sabuli TaxID=2772509 RepID=A0A927BSA4_9BACL|nr:flagellar hook-basal body protein [Paenibacillus sabuli]MBD2845863.1 flagellar hook-basal body protein [Paenibacillus sabuli]